MDLHIFAENEMLTAVAGRSSVAAVGAVAVEGAPRLSAPPAVFTVTWRAPERKAETDIDRVCQERKTYLGKFQENPQASSAPDCTGEQVSGRKPRLRARLKTKREASVFEDITSLVPMSSRAQALVVKSKSLL